RIVVVRAPARGVEIARARDGRCDQADRSARATSTPITPTGAGEARGIAAARIDGARHRQGARRRDQQGAATTATTSTWVAHATTPDATARATIQLLQEARAVLATAG